MRNLFLSLTFLLVGTFVFAANTIEESEVQKEVSVDVVEVVELKMEESRSDCNEIRNITFELFDLAGFPSHESIRLSNAMYNICTFNNLMES